jgi:protein gp37
MSEQTNISFCHHTASPWIGCTKVNDDCLNCYMMWLDFKRFSKTLGGATSENPISHSGKGKPRVRTVGFWKDVRKWNAKPFVCVHCSKSFAIPQAHLCGTALRAGDDLKFQRARVFPSLCDWLDAEVPIEWLADFLRVVYECSNLTWMLFTKRPELWRKRVEEAYHFVGERHAAMLQTDQAKSPEAVYHLPGFLGWLSNWLGGHAAPEHVWIFVSAGNQKNADKMVPLLLDIPAAVHGVSAEPLTGRITFKQWFVKGRNPQIDVVIYGGESDQQKPARVCNVDWIREGILECQDAGVHAYVKQLGSRPVFTAVGTYALMFKYWDDPHYFVPWNTPGNRAWAITDKAGADMNEWVPDLRVRQLPGCLD